MAKNGKGKVILQRRGVEYKVFVTDETGRGPWYEGSTFRAFEGNPIDGHFFVEHDLTDGQGDTIDTIVGVAHTKRELKSKLYECAKAYCVDLARADAYGDTAEFVDQTRRRS